MLEELKQRVVEANLALAAGGLVFRTSGSVSGVDRDAGLMVINPGGVSYDEMTPAQMAVVSLETGKLIEGPTAPNCDWATHMFLYRRFKEIGGVAHANSLYATAWAQSRRDIPPLGTTHGDYFSGPVPCTRTMTDEEIAGDYEASTGEVIAERLGDTPPMALPGVLVASHGPFVWGETPAQAVESATIIEHIAKLASLSAEIDPYPRAVSRTLLEKHYRRKHGPDACCGQK